MIESTVTTASMAPEAPSVCPTNDFVLVSGTRLDPNTLRMIRRSTASFALVPVPWPLT